MKKQKPEIGTDIANPEPTEAITEAGFEAVAGAAAKAVMELLQERLSDP